MKELTEYAGEESGFINEKQLLARLPVARRTLANWRKMGRIPFVKLPGSRRVLYHWKSVEAALLRMQRNSPET
jgi:predicted site-specific integrase-resolvase